MPSNPTGPQPSLFATRPLPAESPAAAYARSTEQPAAPAPAAKYAATQTAAYGQPPYAVNPPPPAGSGKVPKQAAKPVRATKQNLPVAPAQGQGPNANWQASLPVSPWSTYERQSGPGVTGLETETVLRSDLKALKRGRTRARIYLATVVVIAAAVIHFGLRTMEQNATSYRLLRQSHEALRAQVGGTASGAGGEASRQPTRQGSRPLPVGAPAGAVGGEGPSASARTLADDLKRQLAGDAAIRVETRGDRVVVSLEDASLFNARGNEVGPAGFRVLYRFGKALKSVSDRRIVVSIVSHEGNRPRPWIVAAARGISLGRFLLNDLSIDATRVTVATPVPLAGDGKDRVEFSLEPLDGRA